MTTLISYNRALPEVPGRTPYTQPDAYLEKLGAGDYAVRQGRRPSSMFLVDKLRATVDSWRDDGYADISDVTRRLFQFWFDEDHLLADGTPWRYWWAQREAIETLVYLTEARGMPDFAPLADEFGDVPLRGLFALEFTINTRSDGQRILRRWAPEADGDVDADLPEQGLLRYAFRMATGAGKTEVMAMAIVWSYLNRTLLPVGAASPVLAENYLIVAPNVIVYERLKRDFSGGAIFRSRPLVPPEWDSWWDVKVILRGDSAAPQPRGNLFLLNIQQIYESREEEWTPANALDAILGRPPKPDLAGYGPTMLERIKSLKNLTVLNDEAHHVHDDDLAWSQTLLALHANLKRTAGHGLSLWLDFSATPKTQAGTYYPWIIVDYPLAQAIEDQIVKAPLIVHRVNKEDPQTVTAETVVQAYHDWIVVALERWREHTRLYGDVGQKPVLFIMAERTTYADVIAEHIRKQVRLKRGEVLVIHTDAKGRVAEKATTKAARDELEELRDAARNVDQPGNQVKIIVSVLMLREGWDVRNVTVILGLRPFTAQAAILPEQSVGRGLRIMPGIGPDRRQTLEVIGTQKFEEFVRELEHEGVGIDTVGDPPPLPVKIYPVQDKADYDIAIPLTLPRYRHSYRDLGKLEPLALPPIYDVGVLDEVSAIAIKMDFALTGTTVHQAIITPEQPLLSQDFLRDITQRIEGNLDLHGRFAELYGLVKHYVGQRCFGIAVDLDAEDIKRRLRDPILQEGIASFLSREIGELSKSERTIEFEDASFRLSQTPPFTWRRQHISCQHTIFNECAVYNNLEARFAKFLDKAEDVLRFSALAESYTRFRVDYLSAKGAIRFYYPDFVAVQRSPAQHGQTPSGLVNWILETKGPEDENVVHKDASMNRWCAQISSQTGQTWRYLKVRQARFDASKARTLAELVIELGAEEAGLFARTMQPEAPEPRI